MAPISDVKINTRSVSIVSLVAAISGFLFGYTMHMIIGLVPFLQQEFHLTPTQLGFAVSGSTLGCMVGALAAAPLADRLGRKKALALTSFIFMAGCVGVVVCRSIAQFYLFRILSGLGVGVVAAVAPMYVAEISPVWLRGRLVAITQMTIVVSGFLSVVAAYAFTPTSNWRGTCATSILPVLALLAILPLVPESPRWLLEQGFTERARTVLRWVYLEKDTVLQVEREIAASFAKHEDTGVLELFRAGVRRPLLIGVVLALCVQFTGIGPLSWYATIIFQKAGFTRTSDAMLQTLILNAWQLLCSIAAFSLIDRAGRRPVLLTGTVGMALSMACVGVLFHLDSPRMLILFGVILAMGFFNFSLAPVFWVLVSEIFPTQVRAKGIAVSSLAQWIAAFVAAQAIPVFMAFCERHYGNIAPVFDLFAVICAAAFAFSYAMVPETKGRSLEQIGASWARKEPTAVTTEP